MFTGIIEECGELVDLKPIETGAELWVQSSFTNEVELGESVASNGACLTVTEIKNGAMRFDLLHETLRLTNLGDLKPGDPVNLERSLRIGDRLSGHFVQGHVDACAEILAYEPVGQDHQFTVSLPPEFAHLMVHKGSICVNGISLTVAELGPDSFTLWIIPHTHKVTSLKAARVGSRVNLEFDMLAKHIARISEVSSNSTQDDSA
ncbi:MAG: riboflavin synthase [Verrucomicrobiota bacterium]